MFAKLICIDAVAVVQEIPLDRLPLTVGRSEEADVRMNDGWVSRFHCEFSEEAHRLILRDLGSSHGTQVNGKRVSEVELRPGDRVSIGTSTFVVAFQGIPSGWPRLALSRPALQTTAGSFPH